MNLESMNEILEGWSFLCPEEALTPKRGTRQCANNCSDKQGVWNTAPGGGRRVSRLQRVRTEPTALAGHLSVLTCRGYQVSCDTGKKPS